MLEYKDWSGLRILRLGRILVNLGRCQIGDAEIEILSKKNFQNLKILSLGTK